MLSQNIDGRDLKPLRALAEERKLRRYLCVSLERHARRLGEVLVLPWMEFLSALWAGQYT